MGYTGRFAIHPAQLEIINETFSPSPDEVDYARQVVEAWNEAEAEGRGSVALDDRMIDVPVLKRGPEPAVPGRCYPSSSTRLWQLARCWTLMADHPHPPDRIILEGIQLYGYHGANPEEKALGQAYVVDLEVELDLRPAGTSDCLEDTVSYTRLFRAVQEVIEGESKNLLEAMAQTVADKVLRQFPVDAVRVRLKKPRPPIRGSVLDNASVEIYRTRGDEV